MVREIMRRRVYWARLGMYDVPEWYVITGKMQVGDWFRMAIRFCKKCSSLLRPKKGRGGFFYVCSKCGSTFDENDIGEGRSAIPEVGRNSMGSMGDGLDFSGSLRSKVHMISRGETESIESEQEPPPESPPDPSFTPPSEFPLFPFGEVRGGQVDFLRDCKKAFNMGMHLVAYAPTGIGKTVASLVPALEVALRKNKTVMFLTSKQSQHKIAVETLRQMYRSSPHLRKLLMRSPRRKIVEANARSTALNLIVVDIISKQDMCPREFAREYHAVFNEFCKVAKKTKSCPYLMSKDRRVYRRVEEDILHVEELSEIASSSMMCPHKTALDVAQYAHVIICDYNYLFSDISETILEMMVLERGDIIAIVDEAHNLPDRIRGHLSGDITSNRMGDALSELQEVDPQLHHFVKQMKVTFSDLFSALREGMEKIIDKEVLIDDIEAILQGTLDGPMSYKEFHERLTEEGEKRLDAGRSTNSILHLGEFLRIWGQDLPGTARFVSTKGKACLSYRLLDPSIIAEPVLKDLYSAVLMSGTLFPPRMYGDVLGLEHERTVLKEYLSPFPRENRPIYVVDEVTTLYRKRSPEMFTRIADNIRNLTDTFSGNAAVFFPSYALLQEIEFEFMENRPQKQLVVEEKGMNKGEKERLFNKLGRLRYMGGGILMGVQGGSLSEGTDYPDGLLKMVMVVGVPLAPPSLEVDLLTSYYKKMFGQSRGYKYSYLLPALSRVLQAAGRCIRSEDDRGVVVLMDKRFDQNTFKAHFPRDFVVMKSRDIYREIEEFYGE